MARYFRPTEAGDLIHLAANMREIDKLEIKAVSGLDTLPALEWSFNNCDECNTMVADGNLIGIFGLTVEDLQVGIPWMLATTMLTDYSKDFLKQAKAWVQKTNKAHPVLYNYVHTDNDTAIRWLSSLGFKFIKHEPKYGLGEEPFYLFVRIDECV